MKISHLGRRERKNKVKEYYGGILPFGWDTLEELPDTNETEMNTSLSINDFYKASEALAKANVPPPYTVSSCSTTACYDLCIFPEPAPCQAKKKAPWATKACNQEEENSMTQTDTTTQRDYFNARLRSADDYGREQKLRTLFNIDTRQGPASYKELIEWITTGQYKLDEKSTKRIDQCVEDECWPSDPFAGIIFTAKPVADYDGWHAARAENTRQKTLAKDAIMATTDGAVMAKAVADFEAWTPTGKAN